MRKKKFNLLKNVKISKNIATKSVEIKLTRYYININLLRKTAYFVNLLHNVKLTSI